ncbi:MAG: hypothetical protein L6R40_002445 [Gallowayella cf. fulva]|nr:MAG: hypothetical protein L6R40_002445 [Xanthomendoza cf. fulva]
MPPTSRSPSPPTKRLLQELKDLNLEPLSFLQHLGPKSESQLFEWEAVMRGPGGTAYEEGKWHLRISIPTTYPLAPPTITFTTPIIHPNVSFKTGEICLDLLNTSPGGGGAWSPAYTVSKCMEAVWMLLRYPEVDSPLNVDVAVLLRSGDAVAAEGLVRWGCGEWRWRQ